MEVPAINEAHGFRFNFSFTPDSDERAKEYERECESRRQEEALIRYRNSGVPAKFFGESIDTYIARTDEEKRIRKEVERFAERPMNKVLLMCGSNGNGKTHLGCGIIRKCGGEYALSSDICIEYEAAISFKSKRDRLQILRHFCECRMLVVDECGKYALDKELEKFINSYILCGRYERGRPSVFITNAAKERYIEFLGKSVFDRLTECCVTIDFAGESKRKRLGDF